MWVISVICGALLIYGLVTGRMPVVGRVGSRMYSRKTEPTWYWVACATYVSFISLGLVGTFRPDIVGMIVDAAAPILWVIGLLLIFAVMVAAVRRKPREGYLGGDDQ